MRWLLRRLPLASLLLLTGLAAGCDTGGPDDDPRVQRFDYVDTLVGPLPADPLVVVLETGDHDYASNLPPLTVRTAHALRDSVRLVLDVEAWDDTEAPAPQVTLFTDADSLVLWYAHEAREEVVGAEASATAKDAPLPAPTYRVVGITVEAPAGVALTALCGRNVFSGQTACRASDDDA